MLFRSVLGFLLVRRQELLVVQFVVRQEICRLAPSIRQTTLVKSCEQGFALEARVQNLELLLVSEEESLDNA